MKKLFTLMLCASFLFAFQHAEGRTAMNYLIQLGGGSGATWTKSLNANDSIVDLTVDGKSLTAWLSGRTSWVANDQIWIAAGTYAITSYYNIGSSPSLSGSFPTAIYGGFAGTENDISQRAKGANAWDYTNETIIDATGSTTGIFGAGSDRSMTINGLTFTKGNTTYTLYQRGGMTVQNCKFTYNTALAVNYYTTTASKNSLITNCYFANNQNSISAHAACIYSNNGSSGGTYTISNCTFESNSNSNATSAASAGVKAQGAGTTIITGCVFKNNSATAGNSSAVSLNGSTTTYLVNSLIYGGNNVKQALYLNKGNVYNCTVVNNLGGGAYLASTTGCVVDNTVFWGTDGSATTGSGVISSIASNAGASILNCAYNGISANVTAGISGTMPLSTTTTDLFVDPSTNNWSLAAGSPLIDAGTTLASPYNVDFTGLARPQGGAFDIGAFEGSYYHVTVTFNAGGTVNTYGSGAVVLESAGSTPAFTITPSAGMTVSSVLYNGSEVGSSLSAGGTYVAPAISSNATLQVTFSTAVPTGIDNPENTTISCRTSGNKLEVKGLNTNDLLTIFSLTGEKVFEQKVSSDLMTVTLPSGIYVLVSGSHRTKVVVGK
jgi:hypothetical protein